MVARFAMARTVDQQGKSLPCGIATRDRATQRPLIHPAPVADNP